MSCSGDEVVVTLRAPGWYKPEGAAYRALVLFENGDLLDVQDEDGNVEPVPREWCRPHRTTGGTMPKPGRPTSPGGKRTQQLGRINDLDRKTIDAARDAIAQETGASKRLSYVEAYLYLCREKLGD